MSESKQQHKALKKLQGICAGKGGGDLMGELKKMREEEVRKEMREHEAEQYVLRPCPSCCKMVKHYYQFSWLELDKEHICE